MAAYPQRYAQKSPADYGTTPTLNFLTEVKWLIDQDGFVSSAKAKETGKVPTYQMASEGAMQFTPESRQGAYDEGYADRLAYAHKVQEWYANKQDASGFDQEVKTLLASPELSLQKNHLAMAAGAVSNYAREYAQHLERVANPSYHVGDVGERRLYLLKLVSTHMTDTKFGPLIRLNFMDEAGNQLTWATGSPPSEFQHDIKGEWFTADFKIKAHSEFRQQQITELSHLKFKGFGNVIEQEQALLDAKKPVPKVKKIHPLSLTIRLDAPTTEAFSDAGRGPQIALLLKAIHDDLCNPEHAKPSLWPPAVWKDTVTPLKDINDQVVGSYQLSQAKPQALGKRTNGILLIEAITDEHPLIGQKDDFMVRVGNTLTTLRDELFARANLAAADEHVIVKRDYLLHDLAITLNIQLPSPILEAKATAQAALEARQVELDAHAERMFHDDIPF